MPNPTRTVICCGGCEPKCGNCGVPVEIEMTDAEVIAEAEFRAVLEQQVNAEKEAEAARAVAKETAHEKLAALGLTAEEIAAL
jgi:pyruvate-formate lyase-activating enzyme